MSKSSSKGAAVHPWELESRSRWGAFGWRPQLIEQAASAIEKVTREDPELAAGAAAACEDVVPA